MTNRPMKDSGIEWIGEIPENWSTERIGSLYKERNEIVSDVDYPPLSVTKKGIVSQLDSAAKSKDHNNRKKVLSGDFVINSRSDRKMSSGLSTLDGSVSLINIALKSNKVLSSYTGYLLKNYGFAEEFYRWGTGIVADLWSTRYERMKKILVPYPPKEEQQEITNLLDKKVKYIDNILEDTKKSIRNIKEYKQSLITEIVTKGINPNVRMKDSGIEWIGQIPLHWETIKIKRLGTVRNGLTYKPSDIVNKEEGTLVLRSGNIQSSKLSFQDNVYVRKDIRNELKVEKGDILICSRNGSRKLIGKNAIIDENLDASFGAFMMLFKTDEISNYIYYILNSEVFNFYLGTFLTSTINQLTKKNFENMEVVYCPNKNEQNEIVEYLNDKVSNIDTILRDKELLLGELESYKKSIIYEYVTGKKEVE